MKHTTVDRLIEIDAMISGSGYEYNRVSRRFVAKLQNDAGNSAQVGRASFRELVRGVTRGELNAYIAWKTLLLEAQIDRTVV